MRVSFYTLAALVFTLTFGFSTIAQANTQNLFTQNLSLGSQNTQVLELQKILNQDVTTRLAQTGPGSSGQETDYFGIRTKTAVMRFQEKYASEVLTPIGLASATGYVGLYTRTKLNLLAGATPSTPTISTLSKPLPAPTGVETKPSSSTTSQNPNLKNISAFLTAIDATAAEQSISSTMLATITAQVMKEVATTTDLRAAFLKQLPPAPPIALKNSSPGEKILATLEKAFTRVFMPQRALAASAVPFGGGLLYSFYCTQSQTWLLTLTPLPPSYATLLTYVPFTQAFASYNIPTTNWLLGQYEPGAGVCVAGICPYCVTIPSQGMITPLVGSSPT